MKTLVLLIVFVGVRLSAASIAICIDSTSTDTKPQPFFVIVEDMELPSSVLTVRKAPPVDSEVKVIVGGNVQIFHPTLDVTVDLRGAEILGRVRSLALKYPEGHIMLIQEEQMKGIIRTDLTHRKEARRPLIDFVADEITFSVSEHLWKKEE